MKRSSPCPPLPPAGEGGRVKIDKLAALRGRLAELPSALVAFSGGVDSTFLLAAAHGVLGARVLALTALSAATPEGDLAEARRTARMLGARHVEIRSGEIDDPRYRANPTDRCYFCKTELYELCRREARARGIATVLSGTNADELSDWRPGLRAADEHGVLAPLAEVGLCKAEIRALSRALGISTWDKPQSPCLASRIPYGTEVTVERLRLIGQAEDSVRALGFREFRVRYHGELGRLEVAAEEHHRLADAGVRAALEDAIRAAGFGRVELDPRPFRSGRLNEAAGLVPLRQPWVRSEPRP